MIERLQRNRVVREALVFLAFCAFTAALTWPYVLHLRDAVADAGDPYFVSWVLWWDCHQTFTDPLHRVFHLRDCLRDVVRLFPRASCDHGLNPRDLLSSLA